MIRARAAATVQVDYECTRHMVNDENLSTKISRDGSTLVPTETNQVTLPTVTGKCAVGFGIKIRNFI